MRTAARNTELFSSPQVGPANPLARADPRASGRGRRRRLLLGPAAQHVRYCTTSDGVRLAYSVIGKGPALVRPSHWLTHLQFELESPVWRHVVLGLAQRYTLVRYDARGVGLSQRDVRDISFGRWLEDLETVVEAAGLPRFGLLGISQGAPLAVAYAVRHPERVSRLILYGGFARGALHRSAMDRKRFELGRELVREGWGGEDEAYRQWFTSQFIPGGTAEQYHWFNDLQQISATPRMAEQHLRASASINVTRILPKVQAPTLVLHCRDDARIPFALGEELAAGIPGAAFVPLPGRNHLFLAGEPAHRGFFDAVCAFMGQPPLRPLPGTTPPLHRVERTVRKVEQTWLIKLAALLLTVAGVVTLLVRLWRAVATGG